MKKGFGPLISETEALCTTKSITTVGAELEKLNNGWLSDCARGRIQKRKPGLHYNTDHLHKRNYFRILFCKKSKQE
jgi:hypothetical protein